MTRKTYRIPTDFEMTDVTSKIGSGATPRGGEKVYKKEGTSLIRSQNVLDYEFSPSGLAHIDEQQAAQLNGVEVKSEDILLNITGDSIARCCIVPDSILPARVNQHVSIIRANGIDNMYLLYYLQFLKPYLLSICKIGGTRNALTKETIEKLPVLRKDNESKIATVLYTFDRLIEFNKNTMSELEKMARTIFDYWFLQYDFPNEKGKPYKSSGGKMEWDEKLHRYIPKGWNHTTIGEITNCLDARRIPLSDKEREKIKGEYPYYGATGIVDYVNDYIFDGDYVLVAEDGSVMDDKGNPILQRVTGKTWINNHAHVLEPKKGYGCKLLMMLLKDVSVMKVKTGSIQLKVNQDNMNNIVIPDIPSKLIEKMNEKLDSIDKEIINLEQQNEELSKCRDFLLPQLMIGKLK